MVIKIKITNGSFSAEGTNAIIKCNGKKLASDLVIECVAAESYTEAENDYGTTVAINSFVETANDYGTTVTI